MNRMNRPSSTLVAGIGLLLAIALPGARLAAGTEARMEKLQRIQQLILAGDLRQVRKELEQALSRFPNEPALHNFRGVVEAQEGNYQGAESSFKRAIELAPNFTGAYLNLGRLYQENLSKDPSALDKGIETYRQLLRYDPHNAEANYQAAFLLMVQGSFLASLRQLEQLPPEARERPQALAVRCVNYGAVRMEAEAKAAVEGLAGHPELAEEDVMPILPFLQSQGRADIAQQLLEALTRRGRASLTGWRELARLYERQGQFQQARDTLERVAREGSVTVPLLLELAHVAYRQGDFDGTLGYLAHARDLEPKNAAIHFFFGMVCVQLNLANEAYNSLKEAVTLDPSQPFYHYAFAGVVLYREDPSEAVPHFQKYCEMRPGDPRGRLALGMAYFLNRDYQSARRELESIANHPETLATAHYFLGRIANQEGRLDDALAALQKALKADPQNADAYSELGLLHMKQKEQALAEQMLLRALALDPDHYLANLNLLVLYQRTKNPRATEQARRFEEVREKRAQKAKELLRTIEVQR